MYTHLNTARMLESVATTLRLRVLAHVQDPLARQDAEMCMAVLHWAGRLAPVEQQCCARDVREMVELFADLRRLFEVEPSPQGQRIHARAELARQTAADGAADPATSMHQHRTLSAELIETLEDLHALDSQKHPLAAQALSMVCAQLGRRSRRDLEIYLGTAPLTAMVGRD